MADIELVIKIPEELLSEIDDENYQSTISWYDTTLYCAIKDGTPLPKGHGSLIETNAIQSMARKKAEDCFPEGRYDYGYRKALFDFAKYIDKVPIIVKAESEK